VVLQASTDRVIGRYRDIETVHCLAGLMPDRIRIAGLMYVPSDRMTSSQNNRLASRTPFA
jgi:hypothetical protein